MAIERRRDANLYIGLDARDIGYDSRKVPLEMKPKREEIRNDQNFRCAAGGQEPHRFGQIGRATLEERGFDQLKSALPSDASGHGAHGLVR